MWLHNGPFIAIAHAKNDSARDNKPTEQNQRPDSLTLRKTMTSATPTSLSVLKNKKVLVGVTGGIAAYKAAELVRLFKQEGSQVRVVMTASAQEFITPLTFQALTGEPVHTELLNPDAEAGMGHIELARWADVFLVAPASANTIAQLSQGMASDLLATLALARRAPLFVAPAMNQAMWHNSFTQANIERLKTHQITILGPDKGEQACGDVGFGRLLPPATLIQQIADSIQNSTSDVSIAREPHRLLRGRHVVITAGPTREALDPVRYLTNHSSGKMGYALAEAAAKLGAEVTLISGPTQLKTPDNVSRIDVISAEDMLAAALSASSLADTFIACAAVADYRPQVCASQKIKKQDSQNNPTLTLVQNPDIVATIAQQPNKPFTVGFAAETQDVEEYAKSKLTRKNLDLIIANDVSRYNSGFNSNDNEATAFWPKGHQHFPHQPKTQLAMKILQLIHELM